MAISKYDEVAQNLDFARDLSNQFKTLALDEDKARKKMNKKEKQEKAKGDVMKVASALEIQVSSKASYAYTFLKLDPFRTY